MGEPVELFFRGTDGGLRFAARDMEAAFRRVVHGWPVSDAADAPEPFAVASRAGGRWALDMRGPEPRQGTRNEVNAICDLIVELIWSRLRANTALMCLHAAGIEMGGALVVLPSGRRAGKSTLAAELARRGHRLFSDDVLAVDLDAGGVAQGLATGIAPRLRLPLPPGAPARFRAWVEGDAGPSNRQYKYLVQAPVAPFDTALPIGAIVTLERQDGDVPASFGPMAAAEVLPVLIHQNFGRFAHAGRTLAAFGAMTGALPCLRLTYSDFGAAADALEEAVAAGLVAGRAVAQAPDAAVPDFAAARGLFHPERAYRQRPGFHCTEAADAVFVADAGGVGIFRMGPGMLPVWLLLEEPVTCDEIVAALAEVFPDTPPDTLQDDTRAALRQLSEAGLIEPAPLQD